MTLQLNGKPEPEFGGFYAADFAKAGLDVIIAPGGADTPTIELLGDGTVEFAVVSADEIPKARQQGIHAVAIFATFQTNPQGLMTPAERGLKSIADLFAQPGTLAIEAGGPCGKFLKNKYGFDKLKVVPSPFGNLSVLRTDDAYAMQCLVTAEPLAAKKAGLDVTTFLIADAGYDPYAGVLATTDEYARAHPDVVKKVFHAVSDGWAKYSKDPGPANVLMNKSNPTMDLDTFAASAAAQKPLIVTTDTHHFGLGCMMEGRWRVLIGQLKSLGVLTADVAPKDCFMDVWDQ